MRRPWSFDGDGALFRLVSEALRIRLAHLFDPVLAVHTSVVEPLPHQITAVYESMLPRQPLRFLLADDPGAGKTIMAGLLIRELIARGDLERCLIVCPGSLAEQWQDELYQRFQLPFEIMTNDKLEAARTGNWFLETNLVIARLDKLARDEQVQQKLQAPDTGWDLVSPKAIYQSLRRRRERLESRLCELEESRRGNAVPSTAPELDAEDIEDLDDAPEAEVEAAETRILDQATAARSIAELKAEINTLKMLEDRALDVCRRSGDAKWRELASLLSEVFTASGIAGKIGEPTTPYGGGEIPRPVPSPTQKLVLFTEHRDTLHYLQDRITTLLGRAESVVVIHGGMAREDRHQAQEAFRHDPAVQVLLATDAAGEGINLQRAHLMVNYDLPWNPNRLEQRFGRIHRIGQTEVCHLWNLVADETREGDVYQRLLTKLEQARQALGGQVFDVLGKLEFEERPLRELLLEAIRYGEQPEVRARLDTAVDQALDHSALQDLLEERQLVHDAMDASRVQRVREEMERAEARRLQPHYIEAFFLEAFRRIGGSARKREPRRYEVTHVPSPIRNQSGSVLPRYKRIAFDKSLVTPPGQPAAAFVCPGHPLLDAVLDLTLEQHRDLLKRGAVLVDERDPRQTPRVLFYLEHAIQDAGRTRAGDRRIVSKQMLYVERGLGYEPTDREFDRLGYDIESRVPDTGRLRFIEVKGRASGAATITVTKNEILYSLNKPDDFILAIVEFLDGGRHRVRYLRHPFQREPDFGVTSVNYDFAKLLARAEAPA